MYELTQKFTAEFSVRPFINKYEHRALNALKKWTGDSNTHVRRWVSEGTRPRLPWGERLQKLVKDPTANLQILEKLKFDPELYVRKSVSNHLNDIAKDHPDLVVKTLSTWEKVKPKNFDKEFLFIKRQALRTLIKSGHVGALKLMGVATDTKNLSVSGLKLKSTKVKMGGHLEFQFKITNKSTKPIQYLVDYAIYHKKSNGELAPKVFKLKSGKIAAKSVLMIAKKHPFKQITTRVYYPGTHQVEILLNGRARAKTFFTLAGLKAKSLSQKKQK